jgi:hypothetical protein
MRALTIALLGISWSPSLATPATGARPETQG